MSAPISIGRAAAIALGESQWWLTKTPREIAEFQLGVRELCLPFDALHEAMTKALGRDVWTHEFADYDRLRAELMGDRPAPSFEAILALIPKEKLLLIINEPEGT